MESEHRNMGPMVMWARSQGPGLGVWPRKGHTKEGRGPGREVVCKGCGQRWGRVSECGPREGVRVDREHGKDFTQLPPHSLTQSLSTATCHTWSAYQRTATSPLRKTCCAVACPPQASMSTASP